MESPVGSPNPRRWWALAFIALAQFTVIMDTSIIGVALPHIQADLGFSQGNLSWVFNAYVVAFGGLLLLGGRLSDLLGARRVFAAGWIGLAAGSLLAATASGPATVIVGRAVQGAGSALIAPAALTLLMVLFAGQPRELPRALALYGAMAPAGGTAGVFLGGVLTEYLSWPWVYYVNVPIALLVLVFLGLLPATGTTRGSVDVLGAVTVTAGIATAVYSIVRAESAGWTDPGTWLGLGAAAVLLAAFVLLQARLRTPLMRLSILREPDLAPANLAQFLLGAAWIPMWFFLNLYLQQVLGLGAFHSGAALVPMTVAIMLVMILAAPRLLARFGPRALIVTGLGVLALGLVLLSLVRPDGDYWVDVLPASLVAALGMALAFIPSLGTAISSAPPQDGGLASGLVNTTYQVGSALGLAAMTALAASAGADRTGDPVALSSGFSAAFLGAAGIAFAGALLVAVLMRGSRPADRAPEPSADRAA